MDPLVFCVDSRARLPSQMSSAGRLNHPLIAVAHRSACKRLLTGGNRIREERLTSGQAPFVVSHPDTRTSPGIRGRVLPNSGKTPLVELRGLEPLTPCMPCRCATSCATAPHDFSRGAPRWRGPGEFIGQPLPFTKSGYSQRFCPDVPGNDAPGSGIFMDLRPMAVVQSGK